MGLIELLETDLAALIQGLTKETDACGELLQMIVFSQRHAVRVLACDHPLQGPREAKFRAGYSMGDQDGLQHDNEGNEHTQQ